MSDNQNIDQPAIILSAEIQELLAHCKRMQPTILHLVESLEEAIKRNVRLAVLEERKEGVRRAAEERDRMTNEHIKTLEERHASYMQSMETAALRNSEMLEKVSLLAAELDKAGDGAASTP